MAGHTRRDFLKTTGAGALAVGLGAHAQPPTASGRAPTAAQGPGAGSDPQSGAGQGRPPTGNLGTVVWRGDPDYEATRRRMVWNARVPDRFPAAIVTVSSDQDVVEAVKLARARGLQISVRSGGHNWVGSSLRDGGLTVDLSRLTNVTVDPAARGRLLNAIDVKLVRDVPLLPLFQTPYNVALRDNVKGFVPGGNFFSMFEHTEDWWLAP